MGYDFSQVPLEETVKSLQALADTAWGAEADVADSLQKKATYLLTFSGAILAAIAFKAVDAFEHGLSLPATDPWAVALPVFLGWILALTWLLDAPRGRKFTLVLHGTVILALLNLKLQHFSLVRVIVMGVAFGLIIGSAFLTCLAITNLVEPMPQKEDVYSVFSPNRYIRSFLQTIQFLEGADGIPPTAPAIFPTASLVFKMDWLTATPGLDATRSPQVLRLRQTAIAAIKMHDQNRRHYFALRLAERALRLATLTLLFGVMTLLLGRHLL